MSKPKEPGLIEDPSLGVVGDAEEMPFNDADEEFETGIHDDEPTEEEDA